MLTKILLVVLAFVVIGIILYFLLNSTSQSEKDPREGKPEIDLLKANNFRDVSEYLLSCPDFVDHKEGVFNLTTDLALIAQKDNGVYGFKECQKAIDISYGETKLKLILCDVIEQLTSEFHQHKIGTLMVISGSECVLKTKAEVIETRHVPSYRVWTDQEAVMLIKDGAWLSDLNELVRLLVERDEQKNTGSSMLTSAMMGSAIGLAMDDFDE